MFWSRGQRLLDRAERRSCEQQSVWNRLMQPQMVTECGGRGRTRVAPSGVLTRFATPAVSVNQYLQFRHTPIDEFFLNAVNFRYGITGPCSAICQQIDVH